MLLAQNVPKLSFLPKESESTGMHHACLNTSSFMPECKCTPSLPPSQSNMHMLIKKNGLS
jgi:hypothetical protein